MAFKMRGFPMQSTSAFKQSDDKKFSNAEVKEALRNWQDAEEMSEDYRINQLKDEGGSRKEFRRLNNITKEKKRIYEKMQKKSDFKPNIIKNK